MPERQIHIGIIFSYSNSNNPVTYIHWKILALAWILPGTKPICYQLSYPGLDTLGIMVLTVFFSLDPLRLLLECRSILCQLFAQDWPNLSWSRFNNVGVDSIILYKLRYWSIQRQSPIFLSLTKSLFKISELTSLTLVGPPVWGPVLVPLAVNSLTTVMSQVGLNLFL